MESPVKVRAGGNRKMLFCTLLRAPLQEGDRKVL